MAENQQAITPEQSFRDSLGDVITIVRKLSPLCKDTDELIGLCSLAIDNDAQLRLLMGQVAPVQMRRL